MLAYIQNEKDATRVSTSLFIFVENWQDGNWEWGKVHE